MKFNIAFKAISQIIIKTLKQFLNLLLVKFMNCFQYSLILLYLTIRTFWKFYKIAQSVQIKL